MKLLFSFLLFTIYFTSTAQIPSYVPTNGLVGYWSFNGNANDESGNGNNGTVNGATLTSDRFGNVGKAYSFNGQINTVISVALNQPIASRSNKTFSFWVKYPLNYVNPYSLIITCDNIQQGYGQSFMSTNGIHPAYVSANTVGKFYEGKGYMSNKTLNDNLWHHVILVNDFINNKSIVYIDGLLEGSLISNAYLSDTTIRNVYFGNNIPPYYTSDNCAMLGSLDDIAIYNRVLSQSEITSLYNAGTTTCLPSYLPTTGLVGYWPFCGNANDESGNGNNGTIDGASLTSDRFGNTNSAYSFNGSSAIQCSIPSNYSPSSTGNYTFSFWFNINTNPIGTRLLLAYNTPNNASNYDICSYHTSCPTNTIAFQNYPYNNPSACSPELINLHEWNYLTLVFESSNQICKVYKNGVFWYSGNISINAPVAGTLCFGNNLIGGIFGFNGYLDDIAIYNRALTQSEITQLYTSTTIPTIPEDTTSNVGIGTTNPKRKLHINDVMRLEPRNTAPINPGEGDVYYDAILKKLRYYNGTIWISL